MLQAEEIASDPIVELTPDEIELQAECLAAMTGVFPTRAPSEIETTGAQNYVARLRRRINRFIQSSKVEEPKWQEPPSQEVTYAKIATVPDEADIIKWTKGLSLEMAVAWPMQCQRVRDYLKSKWPTVQNKTLIPEEQELATDEYWDFWHLRTLLNDPETLFDDLDSYIVLPDHVEALKLNYPQIHGKIRQLVMLAISPMIDIESGTVKRDGDLPTEKEEQLRILLGIPVDGPIEIKTEEEKPAPTRQSSGSPGDNSQLPSERIAQTRTEKR